MLSKINSYNTTNVNYSTNINSSKSPNFKGIHVVKEFDLDNMNAIICFSNAMDAVKNAGGKLVARIVHGKNGLIACENKFDKQVDKILKEFSNHGYERVYKKVDVFHDKPYAEKYPVIEDYDTDNAAEIIEGILKDKTIPFSTVA